MIFREATGTPEGPPTTARLRAVLNRAARVVIVEGPVTSHDAAGSADLPRIELTGAEIAGLADVLALVDGGTDNRCRCDGWPTIMVHGSKGDLIACWTLHHQSVLRGAGDGDADLCDGPALTEWLAERGLTGSREVQAELRFQETEAECRRMRWVQAAPAGLGDVAADVARPPGDDYEAWSDRLQDAEARLDALTRQRHPDAIERIRALLAWAGMPSRESTSGMMWYDAAVQRQLLAEAPDLVLAAMAARPASPGQLDGLAELFGSLEWTRAHGMQLPEPLRSMVRGHIQAGGTEPMRFRMRHGYYGGEQVPPR
ncbi:hypothetical protein ACGFZK_37055 [Streptomyces sp. NPDC048257]|uniref:hypothetical protein n=1 Tax=Streptomyces sp. NPDC048257 TaxID=3365526 RepID=UPI003714ABCC